jgi:hypothetical protein
MRALDVPAAARLDRVGCLGAISPVHLVVPNRTRSRTPPVSPPTAANLQLRDRAPSSEAVQAGFERCQRMLLLFIADSTRNAVLLVAGGKSGRLREAYLYVWV